MLNILLAIIFTRPLICALAFPYLNFFHSLVLLVFLGFYIVRYDPWSKLAAHLKRPLAAFCLAVIISAIFSRNPGVSLSELYKYAAAVGLFLVGFSLPEKSRPRLITALIWTGITVSCLAIYQYFFSFDHVTNYLSTNQLSLPFALDYLERRRVFMPFVTPGVLGGYLAMIIPLALTGKYRFWIISLMLFAALLTRSPLAFLALFCALLVYFSLQGKLNKKGILILGVFFILIAGVFIWRSSAQKEYVRPAFSMAMRLNYWQEDLMIARTHPFIGVGLGNLNLQMSRYAHNSYLQILAEMGIFGLVSFAWLLFTVLGLGLKKLKLSACKGQICVLISSAAAFLVHNVFDFTFFLPEVAFIWWLILGLISSGKTEEAGLNGIKI